MNNVVDIHSARKAQQLPTREPDIELLGWVEGGEVQWIYSAGAFLHDEPDHGRRTAAVLDMAWVYGASVTYGDEPHDRPLVWCTVSRDGHMGVIWHTSVLDNPSWRHVWWLVRQWARLTRRWARMVLRVALKKGKPT